MKKKEEISSNGISRRDFLKGAATGAAAVAAAGVLPGCATAGAAGAGRADTPQGGDWLGQAPNIPDRQIAETMNCDVLVIGAGMGGTLTAARAAENGLSVIVAEKNDTSGLMREYIGVIDSRLQRAHNTRIDKGEIIHEATRYCANRMDASLLTVWANESGAAMDWFLDILDRNNVPNVHEWDTGHPAAIYKTWPTSHRVNAPGSMNALNAIVNRNGRILYETPMKRLVQQGGRVTGAIMQRSDGSYLQVTASRGVVIATGGYTLNLDMLRALNPFAVNASGSIPFHLMPAGLAGDGIRASIWAGAAFEDFHTAMIFDRTGIPQGAETRNVLPVPGAATWVLGSQPFLRVNMLGERFSNESVPYDYGMHAVANQPGNRWVQVFDSNWRENVARFAATGCARVIPVEGGPAFFPMHVFEGMMQHALSSGNMVRADTMEELAPKLLLPPATFVNTVRRYNELCDRGADEDFFKESFRMIKLDKPPFYGITMMGSLLCTLDGLRINTNMQVLDSNSRPIEGLFCTGNDSGSFFASTYPSRIVGIAAGRTLTFSKRIADLLAGKVS